MKIADFAKQLGITQKALKEAAETLSLTIKPSSKTLTDDEAYLIEEYIKDQHAEATKEKTLDETIEEEIDREMEREIKKAQKKQKLSSKKITEEEKELAEKKKKEEEEEILIKPRAKKILLPPVISVKEFAEKISIPVNKVIAELMKNGLIVTINHKIDFDTASIIADTFSLHVEKKTEDFSSSDLLQGNIEKLLLQEDKKTLQPRPPIISIMGHVDHGKTKLLDYIRKTDVMSTEAGGITQKIGAYQVQYKGKKISFLDTPGHEAFTAMRARGAKATDIAILVIAADEGVKPQTKEAYNHIKEANMPLIVALNKIDKPDANVERAKTQLTEIGIVPEEWGGETVVIPVSAVTGAGVDDLLETILLVAEMNNFCANADRSAIGTVIESNLDTKLGPVATILINTGTLKIEDYVVVGESYGKIKVMLDHNFNKLKIAAPSTPVEIAGLSEVPAVGDILQVEKNLENAKKKALEIKTLRVANRKKAGMGTGMSDIIAKINAGKLKTLKIVLKADNKGSLEAIRASIDKIQSLEVEAKVIHSNVGNITETDVLMAAASGGIVIGFSVDVPAQVTKAAERENVEVRTYRVIYQLLDDIKKVLLGMLDPEIREIIIGEMRIITVFLKDKKGVIAGGKVIKDKILPKVKVRVIRGDKLIGEGYIPSLKREKDNVSEVKEGYECGIRYEGKENLEEGDILQFYTTEKVKKETL